jgi:EAL domain-containing protein (putative c-di-GMP-specific phosphodiesterase class I)
MFLIDINGFKTINELYGVHNGNVILKQFSHLTAALAAQNNIRIFRISSDEFIFLQHSNNNANLGICEELVTKTYDTIRHHRFILYDLDIKIDIDVTIGAVYGETLSLEKADMALNKARKLGRPYLFYSDNIDTKQDTQKIIQVKKDIRYALENNNIVPYFQPIVNTHGEIIKYESLIRMIKLDGGHREVISPFYFLELSEKFNLYSHLSKTVITKSFQAIQNSNMAISINLSPSDIQDAAMNRFIFETLSTCKKTKNIIFEITENEHIEDFESVKKFIKKIQKQGAKIAIDDFGSGYANYSHIFELKPDYIKIDGSLIKNIVENQESQVFVQTIVNLAKGLGTKTIAEYVHSKEVFELVKSYGVDEFQGYYFGEPQSSID